MRKICLSTNHTEVSKTYIFYKDASKLKTEIQTNGAFKIVSRDSSNKIMFQANPDCPENIGILEKIHHWKIRAFKKRDLA